MWKVLLERLPVAWVRTIAGFLIGSLTLVAGFGYQLEASWRENRRSFEKATWQNSSELKTRVTAVEEAVKALKEIAEVQRQEIAEHRQEVRELRKEQVEALRELGRAVDRLDAVRYNRSRKENDLEGR